MARVYIEKESLVIELSTLEKVLSLKSKLVIPLNCIESVMHINDLNEDEIELLLPKIRMGGAGFGNRLYGRFLSNIGETFFVTKDLWKSIVIYTKGCVPYKAIVVDELDPKTLENIKKALKSDE